MIDLAELGCSGAAPYKEEDKAKRRGLKARAAWEVL